MSRESQEERIARVLRERIELSGYDPRWPKIFEEEQAHLRAILPSDLLGRMEHFGSTAVPGLFAKPIVDMLVEVASLDEARSRIAPILESEGYDYFWRPTHGDDGPPFYAWFIRRDPASGVRTHHIHMVESSFEGHWNRLLFRDFLIAHPVVAEEYAELKRNLARAFSGDRVAYTQGKTAFITAVMDRASGDHDSPGDSFSR